MTREKALTILAAVAVTLIAYAAGVSQGYTQGRCETFEAFVIAAGFPVDAKGAYKPAECR
jgi:hypothetical protein